jgi:hypothetical protein
MAMVATPDPAGLVAVTVTVNVLPTSALVSAYDGAVAPETAAHGPLRHRFH